MLNNHMVSFFRPLRKKKRVVVGPLPNMVFSWLVKRALITFNQFASLTADDLLQIVGEKHQQKQPNWVDVLRLQPGMMLKGVEQLRKHKCCFFRRHP